MVRSAKNNRKTLIKKSSKIKIKYKNIVICLIVVSLFGLGIITFCQLPISNIYIINNKYLNDQEIIEYAGLSDYPKTSSVFGLSIKQKLKKHPLINNVKVTKKMFTNVYIEIVENRPLFYDSAQNKTILLDGTLYEGKFNIPFVINYIPDTIYDVFYKQMTLLYPDVIDRISEIKYDPNDVDAERFLLLMKDQNYVYVTIDKFTSINNYLDIVKKFSSKKGILYLDSGEYFKILED